jgi:HAD superfamily hydrolase (TIGR01549 family)
MRTYRILFTGVGRRVELVQAFREASNNLDISLKIYGADMAGTAPALAFCDYTRKVCGMRDIDYIPQLLEICQNDKIDLIIPTIDTDLQVLSKNAENFSIIGTKVLISKPEMIAICRDKNYTTGFFEKCGLKSPSTINDYKKYDGTYPCFIKPKDGSSSINAYKVGNEKELQFYADKIGDYIIQSFIDGTEYSVDIFCDYEGNPISIVPRVRVAVRSGEVIKTEIAMDEKIVNECKKIVERFRPCGPLTVQLIRQRTTGDDYYIEINPRFGGGAPLSMKSGARTAEVILKLMAGENVTYNESAIDGAVYSRFDQSVCVSEGKRRQAINGVIFDLDDTLYSEKQYVRSGYKAVAKALGNELYADRLWQYFENGKQAIDELLKELDCINRKEEFIEIYREHTPEITLYDGVEELICKLKNNGVRVGIITDGRVSGQRKKIQALGLDKLIDDIIITDELGGTQFRKPCDISFRIMRNRWKLPFEQIVYIADNAEKDFQAPKQVGMQSIWLHNEDGLYNQNDVTQIAMTSVTNFIRFMEISA